MKRFPFVNISGDIEEDSDEAVRKNVREGIRAMALIEKGEFAGWLARKFLDEL